MTRLAALLALALVAGAAAVATPCDPRNTTPSSVVEYVATLADGRFVVVTRLEKDWDYGDFRIFVGPVNALAECPVGSVERARDGGSTTIEFTLAGEDATGWAERPLSILHVAAQVRTSQQAQLARENLDRLAGRCAVAMIEPVPYTTVQGVGFYREFLDPSAWPTYMRLGRAQAHDAITRLLAATTPRRPAVFVSSATV
jgi:hypothetical protein